MYMVKIVPDTSVLVDGRLRRFLEESDERYEVIIPEAVVMEIVHQANMGRSIGHAGLEELRHLRRLAEHEEIKIRFGGRRPTIEEIMNAHMGTIDEIVRETAFENHAILVTGDRVQRDTTLIKGGEVIYLRPGTTTALRIENFFDSETMSVHIKSDLPVYAKKGTPGNFKLVKIRDNIKHQEVEDIANDIIERARAMTDSFIEMDERGASVVQLREYRIAITRPPFSDHLEITAVKPIKKLTLEDYEPPEKLLKRFDERAEGILVAGAPGAGKSTFVQALAEYYHSKGKVVKTMEKPRDLMVNDEITQYTALGGSMEKTGDILLLVRPDYTIFDEMRTTDDFKVFADLRLAGAGMIGVVHATRGVDAIQRFIGRVELGTIPQIVDTIIYIINGKIGEIYVLEYTVKVPSGMSQEDLARPVIEVRDFYTDEVKYEIYSFGEQIAVVPIKGQGDANTNGVFRLAAMALEGVLKDTLGVDTIVKFSSPKRAVVYASKDDIPHIIGKSGKKISAIENKVGIGIDVRCLDDMPPDIHKWERGVEIVPEINVKKKTIVLTFNKRYVGRRFSLTVDDTIILEGKLGKDGKIRVSRKDTIGKIIMQALKKGNEICMKIY